MTRRSFAFAAMVLGIGSTVGVWGYVNPNFTPIHVERGAKLIFTARVGGLGSEARGVTLEVLGVLKGELRPKRVELSFSKAWGEKDGPEAVKSLVELLEKNGSEPAVIAGGEFEGKPSALMHVNGVWVRLNPGAGSEPWQFDCVDVRLNSTFNGGTDMLIETLRFVRKFPQTPIMACGAGVNWDGHERIGKLSGSAAALLAVDVNGDGLLDLHAVCPAGDRIWLQKGEKFEELGGVTWGSRAAAWADFDGDGRVDCASLGAEGLTIYLQTAPGRFTAAEVKLPGKPEGAQPTLNVIDLRGDGTADLVLGAGPVPLLLKNKRQSPTAFEAVPLLTAAPAEWGLPGPCVVADFDGDGLADILQCYQKDGVFFRGQPGGTFTAELGCGAAMGPARSRKATLGDFDGDGRLEVLLVGGEAMPVLLQYRGGKFRNVMAHCGEPSYIIQSGAQAAAVADFNNDTFPDLFVCYPDQPGQFFYNRGFRSFAIAEPLRFREDDVPGAEKGQTAAVWADFDKDGAQDLAFALTGGEVYVSKTTLGSKGKPVRLAVRLAPEARCAGPVEVTFSWEGRCLGTRRAGKWGVPAELGVSEPGQYTVRFRLPGRTAVTRTVEVDQESVEIVLGSEEKPK